VNAGKEGHPEVGWLISSRGDIAGDPEFSLRKDIRWLRKRQCNRAT
jgi:hypothetical protein